MFSRASSSIRRSVARMNSSLVRRYTNQANTFEAIKHCQTEKGSAPNIQDPSALEAALKAKYEHDENSGEDLTENEKLHEQDKPSFKEGSCNVKVELRVDGN